MLPTEARHTVAELVSKYRLEPSLRDVYVEGAWDAQLVRRYLARCTQHVVVYEIDTVEILREELLRVDLEDGRRGRVIFLALAMVESGLEPTPAITCLCDSDREAVVGTVWDLWPLLMTDGTSLDMYLWSEPVVSKFLAFACKKPKLTPRELITSLEVALAQVGLIRAALHHTGLGLARRSAKRSLVYDFRRKRVELDQDAFVREVFGEGDHAWLGARLDASLENFRLLWVGDAITLINGDDAVDALLDFAARFAATPQMRNRDALERLLRASLENGDLDGADTFQRLRARICDT